MEILFCLVCVDLNEQHFELVSGSWIAIPLGIKQFVVGAGLRMIWIVFASCKWSTEGWRNLALQRKNYDAFCRWFSFGICYTYGYRQTSDGFFKINTRDAMHWIPSVPLPRLVTIELGLDATPVAFIHLIQLENQTNCTVLFSHCWKDCTNTFPVFYDRLVN